jgi:hypothetical protein
MNIDVKRLRNARLSYEEAKGELSESCQGIIEYAKFLGCKMADGKEDVRVALAFLEGFLSGLEFNRSQK